MAIRVTQAGVALTVGIIVVTGLIIGGLFWVKNSGEQARRDDAMKIAQQNLEDQSGDDVALNEGDADKNSNESSNSSDSDKQSSNSTEKSGSTSTNNSSTNSSNSSGTSTSELPQTGPVDQLPSIIVLALLTFSVASYIASRRQLS